MTQIHTAYDVMKEYLITGAELDGSIWIRSAPASSPSLATSANA